MAGAGEPGHPRLGERGPHLFAQRGLGGEQLRVAARVGVVPAGRAAHRWPRCARWGARAHRAGSAHTARDVREPPTVCVSRERRAPVIQPCDAPCHASGAGLRDGKLSLTARTRDPRRRGDRPYQHGGCILLLVRRTTRGETMNQHAHPAFGPAAASAVPGAFPARAAAQQPPRPGRPGAPGQGQPAQRPQAPPGPAAPGPAAARPAAALAVAAAPPAAQPAAGPARAAPPGPARPARPRRPPRGRRPPNSARRSPRRCGPSSAPRQPPAPAGRAASAGAPAPQRPAAPPLRRPRAARPAGRRPRRGHPGARAGPEARRSGRARVARPASPPAQAQDRRLDRPARDHGRPRRRRVVRHAHRPASAAVGDCLAQTGGNELAKVGCGDPTARFAVLGKLENKTMVDASLDACAASRRRRAPTGRARAARSAWCCASRPSSPSPRPRSSPTSSG